MLTPLEQIAEKARHGRWQVCYWPWRRYWRFSYRHSADLRSLQVGPLEIRRWKKASGE